MAKNTWDSMWDSGPAASRPDADDVAASAYYFANDTGTLSQSDGISTWTDIGAFQVADLELSAIAALTSAANKLPYFTGSGTAALADLTAFARTVLDDADAATARATLGAVSVIGGGLETLQAHGNTGATETFDLANGNHHSATLDASCTFTFSGATNGKLCTLSMRLTKTAGSETVTWPGSVSWPDGSPPTLHTGAGDKDFLIFLTEDGGTTWYGFHLNADTAGGAVAAEDVSFDDTGLTYIVGADVQAALEAGDAAIASAVSGSGTLTTVEDANASPTDSAVTKLVFPEGTVAIASHVATITPAVVVIADQLLGSDTASFDFTSIPGTFRHLRLMIQGRSDRSATSDTVNLRFNNDSGANYDREQMQAIGTSGTYGTNFANGEDLGATSITQAAIFAANSSAAGSVGSCTIDIYDYAGTTFHKTLRSVGGVKLDTGSGNTRTWDTWGLWRSTSAITRITLLPNAGSNFKTGSRATLYGIT